MPSNGISKKQYYMKFDNRAQYERAIQVLFDARLFPTPVAWQLFSVDRRGHAKLKSARIKAKDLSATEAGEIKRTEDTRAKFRAHYGRKTSQA